MVTGQPHISFSLIFLIFHEIWWYGCVGLGRATFRVQAPQLIPVHFLRPLWRDSLLSTAPPPSPLPLLKVALTHSPRTYTTVFLNPTHM